MKGGFCLQEGERMFLACRSLSRLGCVSNFQTGHSLMNGLPHPQQEVSGP